MTNPADRIAARIVSEGPVPFGAFMDAALYGPGGFYDGGHGAGRRRDFITSPETGELFGKVIARALDHWWEECGSPDPFLVVECGAGSGALARTIRRAAPACGTALRYVLVERGQAMRTLIGDGKLPLVEPWQLLGATEPEAGGEPGERRIQEGQGPLFAVLEDLPVGIAAHVVLANELLDNLVFDVLERRDGRWSEVRVGWGASGAAAAGGDGGDGGAGGAGTVSMDAGSGERAFGEGGFGEVLVDADPAIATRLDDLVGDDLPDGVRVPRQHGAAAWLREVLGLLGRGGRAVAIDYARPTTADLAHAGWSSWCRTYAGQNRGGSPLDRVGEQDITCDVAVDQLARVRVPAVVRSQSEFLRSHGIDEIVESARSAGDAAPPGAPRSLDDLARRSLVNEAPLLVDESGLGGFTVLEWHGA